MDEILFEIIPDFPTPEKIILPLHFNIQFTILSNSLLIDFLSFLRASISLLITSFPIKENFYSYIFNETKYLL